MTLSTLVALVGAALVEPSGAGARSVVPDDPALVVTLAADHPVYYVGEPVFLTLTFRNVGEVPLQGFFVPRPGLSQVLFRRDAGPFIPLLPRRVSGSEDLDDAGNRVMSPLTLKPAEQVAVPLLAVVDARTQRFVLDQPGAYEFKVTTRVTPADPSQISAAVVSVRVEAVPSGERAAFADYARLQLARVIQAPGHVLENDRKMVHDAIEFIDRYPHSRYARPVRRAVSRALRSRVIDGRATSEDQALLTALGEDGEDVP